jgi:enoyl-CoA hydratase
MTGIAQRYDFKNILVEHRPNGVVVFTLNRPDRMNATDAVLHDELAQFPKLFDADPDGKVAVLTGAGKAFSAGGDYDMMASDQEDYHRRVQIMQEAMDIVYGIADCRKPIVSAINGAAAGAGLAAALMADISVVSEEAVLADGHAPIGLVAGDHAVLIWPLLCSLAKAKLYALTGRRINGREAERIGLVSMAVPPAEVLDTALEIADELAERSPLALQLTKRSFNHWIRDAMPAFESSLAYEMVTAFNPDFVQGLDKWRNRKR